jgi:galactokinase
VSLDELVEWSGEMAPNVFKRARHIVSDSARAQAAAAALKRGDLAELGSLMADAHRSYRDDFEASCEEADILVDMANTISGLVGSRLTGGGWGGCTVNLVEQDSAQEFAVLIREMYQNRTGIEAQVHLCHASEGARLLLDR